jgi:hypothetical protein
VLLLTEATLVEGPEEEKKDLHAQPSFDM